MFQERLKRELNFSGHLGLSALLLDVRGRDNLNLSRHIYSFLSKSNSGPAVWLRVPINPLRSLSDDGEEAAQGDDPWDWWHAFRANASYEKRLALTLDLTQLGADGGAATEVSEDRLLRWLGEPVKGKALADIYSRERQKCVSKFLSWLWGDTELGLNIKDLKSRNFTRCHFSPLFQFRILFVCQPQPNISFLSSS